MSEENFLIDGKIPLHTLRVVDLREELKKRGIKATGTKSHLQALLISAIQSAEASQVDTATDEVVEQSLETKEDAPANDSAGYHSTGNSSEQKFASISINEEKETIKLTIRCSPRKSEPSQVERSESESEPSPGGTSDSEDYPSVRNEDNVIKDDATQDSINSESSINDSKESSIENVSNDVNDSTVAEKETSKESELAQVDIKDAPSDVPQDISHSTNEVSKDDIKDSLFQVSQDDSMDTSDEVSQDTKTPDSNNDIPKDDARVLSDEVPKVDSNETQDDIKKSSVINDTSCRPVVDDSKDLNRKSFEKENKNINNTDIVKNAEVISTPENDSKIENLSQTLESSESKIKPIRGRLLSQSKSVNEDDPQKPIQKKRRWGSSKTSDPLLLNKGISSDKLKQLINESVVVEDVSPTKVSKSDSITEDETIVNEIVNDQPEEDNSGSTKKDGIFVTEEIVPAKTVPTKVVENVTEETEKSRSTSPAKNPVSTVLFITGLVRPYTLIQLKKLLSLTGIIEEDKFWIDKIKSKCYVAYSSVEDAVKTRESLHHLKWPQSSPKNLSVEFATLEDIDRCLHPENYEDLPIKSAHTNEKPLPDIEMGKGKYDIILNEAIRQPKEQDKIENKEQGSSNNIREWDRNKVNRLNNRSDNKEEDNRKRARYSSPARKEHSQERPKLRSKSPEKQHRHEERQTREPAKRRSESPVKLLEDLFRKTKGTPYIYWLPLTDAQIVEKEKLRSKLEKEREERITARKDVVVRKRNDSPMNRPPPPMNPRNVRDRPKVPEYRRRSPSPQFRRKRSASHSPRNFSRYSVSPDRRRNRFSPRRRR